MDKLKGMGRWLERRAENILALLLGSMFAAFIVQIVFRYFLNLPLGWTVEYVTIAWLWGIFFGYTFVVKADDAIRLDIVYQLVPPGARRVMDVAAGLVCAGIFAWSIPKAWDFVTFMAIERTSFMRIRFDIVFSIYIPFAIAVVVRSLLSVWRALKGRPSHHDPLEAPVSDEHA